MLSLRQQIAQMLIIGFAGIAINESDPVKYWLAEEGIGGVILFDFDLPKNEFGKNLINPTQIKKLTQQLREYASQSFCGQKDIPLFIALDYEGGAVDRLRHIDGCMHTKTAKQLAELTPESFMSEVSQMAATLDELGFNLNFAPVVDLNLNEQEGIIGKLERSFSADPEQVTNIAKIFVKAFAEKGISCCYKHFPGHGSALGDTHAGFVDVTETFQIKELAPYQGLLTQNKLPLMVMTAHVVNRNLDPSGLPATLSKAVLTNLLRHELKFDGIIISDDLQMQAITDHYSLEEALSLTINAGADMVILGNQLGNHTATEIIDMIERLVCDKKIAKSRIDEAYRRIIHLKHLLSPQHALA